MADWKLVKGHILFVEAPILQEYCAKKKVLELGMYKGKSTCIIAPVAKEVASFDISRSNEDVNELMTNIKEYNNVSYYLDATEEQLNEYYEDNHFDVAFIASTRPIFSLIKKDIEMIWPKLKKGGIIIFYNTNWDAEQDGGVWKAITTFFKESEVEKNINLTSISIVKKIREDLVIPQKKLKKTKKRKNENEV